MNYAKTVLSLTAALALGFALFMFEGIWGQKATGLGAVAGGLLSSLFSPLFWIVALAGFALFFTASHSPNKLVAAIFFWVPSSLLVLLGAGATALLIYVYFVAARPT
jgi:hypothetical protein